MEQTYYLSPSGDDTADGRTPATAWRTLARLQAHAHAPGDTYLFQGGAIFTGALELYVGDPENPITLASYGEGRATIASGGRRALWMLTPGGLHVHDLNLIGDGTAVANGIDWTNDGLAGNLRFERLTVRGYRGTALHLATNPPGVSAISVEDCDLYDNAGGVGIGYGGDSVSRPCLGLVIRRNRIHHNNRVAEVGGIGIMLDNVRAATIEDNLIHNNGGGPAPGHAGMHLAWCSDLHIRRNEVWGQRDGIDPATGQSWGDGQAIALLGSLDCLIEQNYTHNNAGAGYQIMGELSDNWLGPMVACQNVTVRGNVSEDDGQGIVLKQEVWNAVFEHNTIFSRGENSIGILVTEWVGSAEFRGNLLLGEGGAIQVMVGAECLRGANSLQMVGNGYCTPQMGWLRIYFGGDGFADVDSWRDTWGQEYEHTEFVGDPQLPAPGQLGTVGDFSRLLEEMAAAYKPGVGSPAAHLGAFALVPVGLRDSTQ